MKRKASSALQCKEYYTSHEPEKKRHSSRANIRGMMQDHLKVVETSTKLKQMGKPMQRRDKHFYDNTFQNFHVLEALNH